MPILPSHKCLYHPDFDGHTNLEGPNFMDPIVQPDNSFHHVYRVIVGPDWPSSSWAIVDCQGREYPVLPCPEINGWNCLGWKVHGHFWSELHVESVKDYLTRPKRGFLIVRRFAIGVPMILSSKVYPTKAIAQAARDRILAGSREYLFH